MRNKYNAIKTTFNGVVYDSKKEAAFAQELETLCYAKDPSFRVVNVLRQVDYPVVIGGEKICTYKADFKVTYADGRSEVIDVKGMKTPVYKLKKKLVEAIYKIKIIEQ